MLPSFRLIAATFLCGFFVVFAGLRLAASLNNIHEGLPVLAAHAAPVSITPVADRDARRGLAAVPVMYDLRFAIGTVAPTLVRVPPTALDQPAPPLSIVPTEDVDSSLYTGPDAGESLNAAEPEATVAAIPPAAPVIMEPAVASEAPAAPEAPAAAATDAAADPGTSAEHPAAATPAPESHAMANEPQATPAPAIEQSLPSLEPGAAPAESPATPEPKPRSPAAALPASKSQATKSEATKSEAAKSQAAKSQARSQAARSQAAKSSPRARVKVARKKQTRVARRAAPTNRLENTFGNSNGAFATLPGIAQR